MKLQKYLTVTALIFTAAVTHAQKEKTELSFSGFVDTYYAFNLNEPPNVGAAAVNNFRYNDQHHNSISLSLAELTMLAKRNEVTLLVDFDYGVEAEVNSMAVGAAASDEISKHIGQAVLTYKPNGSRFTLEGGKMYTHVGFESVKTKDNVNYSRTTMAGFGTPVWHSGIAGRFDITETMHVKLFLLNGWNIMIDNNSSKTMGLQFGWAPGALRFYYNVIGGAEQTTNEGKHRVVQDVSAFWKLSDKLLLGGEIVVGYEDLPARRNEWYGGQVLAKFNFSESSYLSPRLEIYRDQNGYTLSTVPQTLTNLTVTYGLALTQALELRAEARMDRSTEKTFKSSTESRDNQVTLLGAMLFVF